MIIGIIKFRDTMVYGEKGYFNTIDFKWCTKRMSSFDDNKVKD